MVSNSRVVKYVKLFTSNEFEKLKISIIGYLWFAFLLKIIDVPILVRQIISLPFYLIVPISLGYLIHKRLSHLSRLRNIIVLWMIGSITLTLSGYILIPLLGFHLFVIIVLFLCSLGILTLSTKYISIEFKSKYSLSLDFLLLIFSSIIPAILVGSLLPYPEQYHVVLPHHNRVILEIIDSNVSLGTISYTIFPYILPAIISWLFDLDSLYLFWIMPFLLYTLYGVGLYVFACQVTGNKKIALYVAFMGVWIFTYEGAFAENYSFTPRGLLHLLFPYFLGIIYRYSHNLKVEIKDIIYICLPATIIYFISMAVSSIIFFRIIGDTSNIFGYWPIFELTLYFSLLLGYAHLIRKSDLKKDFVILFLLIVTTSLLIHNFEGLLYIISLTIFLLAIKFKDNHKIFLGSILLYSTLLFESIDLIELPSCSWSSMVFGSTYSYSGFHNVLTLLIESMTFPIFSIFVISLVITSILVILLEIRGKIYSKKVEGSEENGLFEMLQQNKVNLITLSFLLFFAFFPDPMAYRFFGTIPPFATLLMSTVIIGIIPTILKILFKMKIFYIFYLFLMLILIIPNLPLPLLQHHHPTYVPFYEYMAAKTINEKFSIEKQRSIMVVSDVRTSTVISGLSYVESFVPRRLLPQEYHKEEIERVHYVKDILTKSKSSREIYHKLINLSNGKGVIIVITGRTIKFLSTPAWELSFDPIISITDASKRYGYDLSLLRILLEDKEYFELIYQDSDNIYVFITKNNN